MNLKIIVIYDIDNVPEDIDLDDLASEIEDNNYLDTPSLSSLSELRSVHIATKYYSVQADDAHEIGKVI